MDPVSALCSRHEVALLVYFQRRTASVVLARELADETWAAARLAARRHRPGRGTPEAWLFAIARETLTASLRAGRVADRARNKLGIVPASGGGRSAHGISETASDERLAAFAAGLPPALAEAVAAEVPARDAAALAARLVARDEADAGRTRRSGRRTPLVGRLRLAGR